MNRDEGIVCEPFSGKIIFRDLWLKSLKIAAMLIFLVNCECGDFLRNFLFSRELWNPNLIFRESLSGPPIRPLNNDTAFLAVMIILIVRWWVIVSVQCTIRMCTTGTWTGHTTHDSDSWKLSKVIRNRPLWKKLKWKIDKT